MGYVYAIGQCYSCNCVFGFNPMKVPSLRDKNGVKQPVCKTCIDRANVIRVQNGMAKLNILPGAYDECDENELPLD